MAQMETKTISFHQVTNSYPTRSEIVAGVYALNKVSGDLVKIPPDVTHVSTHFYSVYAPVSAFPSVISNPYAEKYADLVKAKETLKTLKNDSYYGYYCDSIGKAIGLIKRFLDQHGKV
jgi:hypothetical protein